MAIFIHIDLLLRFLDVNNHLLNEYLVLVSSDEEQEYSSPRKRKLEDTVDSSEEESTKKPKIELRDKSDSPQVDDSKDSQNDKLAEKRKDNGATQASENNEIKERKDIDEKKVSENENKLRKEIYDSDEDSDNEVTIKVEKYLKKKLGEIKENEKNYSGKLDKNKQEKLDELKDFVESNHKTLKDARKHYKHLNDLQSKAGDEGNGLLEESLSNALDEKLTARTEISNSVIDKLANSGIADIITDIIDKFS